MSATHAGQPFWDDRGIIGHRYSRKGSLLFPRLPASLALGIRKENLGLDDGLVRLLGSCVLLRTRVIICNTFSLHNVNELGRRNKSNMVDILWRAYLLTPLKRLDNILPG